MGVLPLRHRWFRSDLIKLLSIVEGQIRIPPQNLLHQEFDSAAMRNGKKFTKHRLSRESRANFFSNRVVNRVNQLTIKGVAKHFVEALKIELVHKRDEVN